MHEAKILEDLHFPPSNYLEKLQGDRKHQYSIRIKVKNPLRICFESKEDGFYDVEIVDYH